MKKLIRFIPLILFIALAIVLYRGLFLNPQAMPSALVGKSLPSFKLSVVNDENALVTEKDLTGDIVLINVWGTWCPSCRYEHAYLLELSQTKRFSLYGLNYDDEREDSQQWLRQLKNPYVFSLFDDTGKLTLDLGVYAAPETFVVDHHRIIRKRFAGPIDSQVWEKEFEPLIRQIEAEKRQGE